MSGCMGSYIKMLKDVGMTVPKTKLTRCSRSMSGKEGTMACMFLDGKEPERSSIFWASLLLYLKYIETLVKPVMFLKVL